MRGDNIQKSHWHDAGAYGRCSYCGRYSDNSNCLKPEYKCDCGKQRGYCGSFKKPMAESTWNKN
jgi:hypothetical protein